MIDGVHDLPPWLVPAYVARHGHALGAVETTVLLQDYGQRLLIPLTKDAVGSAVVDAQPIDGTLAGRAFTTVQPVEGSDPAGVRLFVPLLDGGARVGVLALTLHSLDHAGRRLAERFAAIVASLVVTKGAHTDVYFRARRRRDMTLAAEMQWHLLPPLTLLDPRITVTGCLEPAYEVGGDAFDYAINHEIAHFAIFDAMGHGLDASVMAAVAVGAYRHARRTGVPVSDMYTLIDAAFAGQFGPEKFVTAQLANLHLPTGELSFVNAGHPPPMLIRGHRVVRPLGGPRTLPVGFGGQPPEVILERLEPGDRLLLYSDGVVDNRRDGEALGDDRLAAVVEHELATELPLTEVLRRVNQRLLEWSGGVLRDDSTLMLVEWRTRHLAT
jgi:serine phosphatase RsbU (regulator of sigma subunit)